MYTDIPIEVKESVLKQIKTVYEDGNLLLISRKYLDNNFLYLVLVQNKRGYTVWLYNSSLNVLCDGHYDLNLKDALTIFANKLC